jgi:hypothetical protein
MDKDKKKKRQEERGREKEGWLAGWLAAAGRLCVCVCVFFFLSWLPWLPHSARRSRSR